MWCPEGFYAWDEAYRDVHNIADEIVALICMGGKPQTTVNGKPRIVHTGSFYLVKHGIVADDDEADFFIWFLGAWLMAQFMESFPPILASTSGSLGNVSPIFLAHKDGLEICGFSWPINQSTPFQEIFKLARDGNFRPVDVDRRFAFIDTATGTLTPKNGTREFLINYQSYDAHEAELLLRFVHNIQGHVLCWRSKPSTSEMREFLGCIEIGPVFTASANFLFGEMPEGSIMPEFPSTQRNRGGRPNKVRTVAEAYNSAFPEGHGDMTKKILARELTKIIGFEFSEDTLARALALARYGSAKP